MRKRSKYRPRPTLTNPLGYVIEGITPVANHKSYLVDLKLKNHAAMTALTQGAASKTDINTLIAMHNIQEAIHRMLKQRVITDLPIELDQSTLIRGKAALIDLSSRCAAIDNFVCHAPEIQAINDLMAMHDELMDFITVRHMDKAIAFARHEIACNRATVINDYINQKDTK
jgi:hypothetical protein